MKTYFCKKFAFVIVQVLDINVNILSNVNSIQLD